MNKVAIQKLFYSLEGLMVSMLGGGGVKNCIGGRGTKILQILRYMNIYEVPENNKTVRNTTLWVTSVALVPLHLLRLD